MNTCKWEKQILLDAAGELTERQKHSLQAHLEHCDSCRHFQADYTILSQEYAAAAPDYPMPDGVKQRLINAANPCRTAARDNPVIIWIHAPSIQPWLAMAALLLVCLTGFHIYRQIAAKTPAALVRQTATPKAMTEITVLEDSWDEEFIELEESFAVVDQEWQRTDRAWLPGEETELLAQDLLEMEKSS